MKNLKLLLIAVVLIIVAVVLQKSKTPAIPTDLLVGKSLITSNKIDNTVQISLKSAKGTVNLKRENNAWYLPELHGLKADNNKVEELFQQLNQDTNRDE